MTIKMDCGSSSNLNHELLLKTFFEYFGLTYTPQSVEIRRVSLDWADL